MPFFGRAFIFETQAAESDSQGELTFRSLVGVRWKGGEDLLIGPTADLSATEIARWLRGWPRESAVFEAGKRDLEIGRLLTESVFESDPTPQTQQTPISPGGQDDDEERLAIGLFEAFNHDPRGRRGFPLPPRFSLVFGPSSQRFISSDIHNAFEDALNSLLPYETLDLFDDVIDGIGLSGWEAQGLLIAGTPPAQRNSSAIADVFPAESEEVEPPSSPVAGDGHSSPARAVGELSEPSALPSVQIPRDDGGLRQPDGEAAKPARRSTNMGLRELQNRRELSFRDAALAYLRVFRKPLSTSRLWIEIHDKWAICRESRSKTQVSDFGKELKREPTPFHVKVGGKVHLKEWLSDDPHVLTEDPISDSDDDELSIRHPPRKVDKGQNPKSTNLGKEALGTLPTQVPEALSPQDETSTQDAKPVAYRRKRRVSGGNYILEEIRTSNGTEGSPSDFDEGGPSDFGEGGPSDFGEDDVFQLVARCAKRPRRSLKIL